jgi:hypothetical protein
MVLQSIELIDIPIIAVLTDVHWVGIKGIDVRDSPMLISVQPIENILPTFIVL